MEENERRDLDETEERLRRTWHSTPAPALPAGFRDEVMRDIRAAAVAGAGRPSFARAVGLGTIAAGFLAAAAGLLAMLAGVRPSGELYVLVKSYPEALVEWLLVL